MTFGGQLAAHQMLNRTCCKFLRAVFFPSGRKCFCLLFLRLHFFVLFLSFPWWSFQLFFGFSSPKMCDFSLEQRVYLPPRLPKERELPQYGDLISGKRRGLQSSLRVFYHRAELGNSRGESLTQVVRDGRSCRRPSSGLGPSLLKANVVALYLCFSGLPLMVPQKCVSFGHPPDGSLPHKGADVSLKCCKASPGPSSGPLPSFLRLLGSYSPV